jgi:hypothetical protein
MINETHLTTCNVKLHLTLMYYRYCKHDFIIHSLIALKGNNRRCVTNYVEWYPSKYLLIKIRKLILFVSVKLSTTFLWDKTHV